MAGFEPPQNLHDPLFSLFSLPMPMGKSESLPPYEEQLMLVDLYFLYFHNQPYSLFHESDFRIRFHTGTLPDYLLLAVMVNSFRFVNNSSTAQERLQIAATFADSAWQSISKDCFSGKDAVNLSIIQTLTLLCIFDFTGEFNFPLSIRGTLEADNIHSWSHPTQLRLGEDRDCCTTRAGFTPYGRTRSVIIRG